MKRYVLIYGQPRLSFGGGDVVIWEKKFDFIDAWTPNEARIAADKILEEGHLACKLGLYPRAEILLEEVVVAAIQKPRPKLVLVVNN